MTDPNILVAEHTAQGVRFRVKVLTRAKRVAIAGVAGGVLKIRVNVPPVEGRANKAVIALLARELHVPNGSVKIAAGERVSNKTIVVAGLTASDLRARFGLAGPPHGG